MTFNSEKFEDKLSALINKELNKAYSCLLKFDEDTLVSKGIDLQHQVLKSLHNVTEEAIIQISHGLFINLRPKSMKVPFYDLKKGNHEL